MSMLFKFYLFIFFILNNSEICKAGAKCLMAGRKENNKSTLQKSLKVTFQP